MELLSTLISNNEILILIYEITNKMYKQAFLAWRYGLSTTAIILSLLLCIEKYNINNVIF